MIASFITALYLLGIINAKSATTSLVVAGVLLIIAELGVVSFGLLFFNGLIALYAAAMMFTGTDVIFGVNVGWPVLFGIATVEILIIVGVVCVHMWLKGQKTTTGVEAMIGSIATVVDWDGTKGNVRFEGELWKAKSDVEMNLDADDEVKISAVNNMFLKITA